MMLPLFWAKTWLLMAAAAAWSVHAHSFLLLGGLVSHSTGTAISCAAESSNNNNNTKMTPKQVLLKFIAMTFGTKDANDDRLFLPCGLDATCSDEDRQVIVKLVEMLEQDEDHNTLLQSFNCKISGSQILGSWSLLYTSSRTMRINKSLSGLGRSSSDMANFNGLVLKLEGSEYLGFMEFVERIGSSSSSSSSSSDDKDQQQLQVKITGEWMLQPETNPFTGSPTTALRLDPETVDYAGATQKAQDWNSLGPIKLLDILYLDDNLLITRGNVNTESIFVFERI